MLYPTFGWDEPAYHLDGDLEGRLFSEILVDVIADFAGVRTTWFADPWGVVFILVEKGRPQRPYFAQFG